MSWKLIYTLEERQKIKQLLNERKSGLEIASILKKSNSGMYEEIKRRGGFRNYDPTLEVPRPYGTAKNLPRTMIIKQLSEKVEMLEMQVEILHDIITGMAKK